MLAYPSKSFAHCKRRYLPIFQLFARAPLGLARALSGIGNLQITLLLYCDLSAFICISPATLCQHIAPCWHGNYHDSYHLLDTLHGMLDSRKKLLLERRQSNTAPGQSQGSLTVRNYGHPYEFECSLPVSE